MYGGRVLSQQEAFERSVAAGQLYDDLPERVRRFVGTKEEWKVKAKAVLVRHGGEWSESFGKHVCGEMEYYEELLKHMRACYRVFPYHLAHYIVRVMRITPFRYYSDMLLDHMRNELSYDAIPNFTAADIVRVVGIGRNEFIALMNKCKSKLMWKFNKAIAKDALPLEPVTPIMEPWWRVSFVNVGVDEYKKMTPEELSVVEQVMQNGVDTVDAFSPAVLIKLYKAGLIHFVVPMAGTDRISVPPLEGFVSNRDTIDDPLESLLYAMFLTNTQHTTVSEVAELLGANQSLLEAVVSLACRLGFAKKVLEAPASPGISPRASMGGAEPPLALLDASDASYAQALPDGAAPSSRYSFGGDDGEFDKGASGADASFSTSRRSGRKRAAVIVDAAVTGFLMMGNLSQGLKRHAVTLFEAGKMVDACSGDFVQELENVADAAIHFEGDVKRFADHATSLGMILQALGGGGRGSISVTTPPITPSPSLGALRASADATSGGNNPNNSAVNITPPPAQVSLLDGDLIDVDGGRDAVMQASATATPASAVGATPSGADWSLGSWGTPVPDMMSSGWGDDVTGAAARAPPQGATTATPASGGGFDFFGEPIAGAAGGSATPASLPVPASPYVATPGSAAGVDTSLGGLDLLGVDFSAPAAPGPVAGTTPLPSATKDSPLPSLMGNDDALGFPVPAGDGVGAGAGAAGSTSALASKKAHLTAMAIPGEAAAVSGGGASASGGVPQAKARPSAGFEVDLLRCESLASLSQEISYRILCRDYAVVLCMAPLQLPTYLLPPHLAGPNFYGTPFPNASSPWLKLFLYKTLGVGPVSLVLPRGLRLARLPHPLAGCRRATIFPWYLGRTPLPDLGAVPDGGGGRSGGAGGILVNGSLLLQGLNEVLRHTAVMVQPVSSHKDSSSGARSGSSGSDGSGHRPCEDDFDVVDIPLPLPESSPLTASLSSTTSSGPTGSGGAGLQTQGSAASISVSASFGGGAFPPFPSPGNSDYDEGSSRGGGSRHRIALARQQAQVLEGLRRKLASLPLVRQLVDCFSLHDSVGFLRLRRHREVPAARLQQLQAPQDVVSTMGALPSPMMTSQPGHQPSLNTANSSLANNPSGSGTTAATNNNNSGGSAEASSIWVVEDLWFGLPLFDTGLCAHVCGAGVQRLLDPAGMANHRRAMKTLRLQLKAFVTIFSSSLVSSLQGPVLDLAALKRSWTRSLSGHGGAGGGHGHGGGLLSGSNRAHSPVIRGAQELDSKDPGVLPGGHRGNMSSIHNAGGGAGQHGSRLSGRVADGGSSLAASGAQNPAVAGMGAQQSVGGGSGAAIPGGAASQDLISLGDGNVQGGEGGIEAGADAWGADAGPLLGADQDSGEHDDQGDDEHGDHDHEDDHHGYEEEDGGHEGGAYASGGVGGNASEGEDTLAAAVAAAAAAIPRINREQEDLLSQQLQQQQEQQRLRAGSGPSVADASMAMSDDFAPVSELTGGGAGLWDNSGAGGGGMGDMAASSMAARRHTEAGVLTAGTGEPEASTGGGVLGSRLPRVLPEARQGRRTPPQQDRRRHLGRASKPPFLGGRALRPAGRAPALLGTVIMLAAPGWGPRQRGRRGGATICTLRGARRT
eukprot:jgi/Mesvir1/5295/Mv15395-RA.1